jgi:hypothetical protein
MVRNVAAFILWGCAMPVLALYLVVSAARDISLASESKDWLTAKGAIKFSRLNEIPRRKGRSVSYKAAIVYEYVVNDVVYVGTRLSFQDVSSGKPEIIQKMVNKHPVGQEVVVYYSEADPENSVLNPSVHISQYAQLGLYLLLFLVSLGAGLYFWKKIEPHIRRDKRQDA